MEKTEDQRENPHHYIEVNFEVSRGYGNFGPGDYSIECEVSAVAYIGDGDTELESWEIISGDYSDDNWEDFEPTYQELEDAVTTKIDSKLNQIIEDSMTDEDREKEAIGVRRYQRERWA